MDPKTILFVFVVLYFSSGFSHGQQNKTSLQEDYKYIAAVDSFYKYHATPMSWSDAKQACAQEGASLFYPENSDEANAVISFWKEYENNTPSDDTWVYVGISDIITEGKFETIDGKSISEVYNIWKANMPDNYENNEDCLHLNQIGNLNDIKCDATYHFICKKSLPPPERNYSGNIQDSQLDGQQNKTSLQEEYKYIAAVDSLYKYHATPKSWSDAKQACAQEGASLFYPENSDEANAVISFWKEYENNTPSDDTWVYVGISDIMTEGKFETIDGKSMSEVYNIWKANMPDNYENNEDCLHLNQIGNLNDIKCDATYHFICKKSLPPPERNYSGNIQDSQLDGQQNKTSLQEEYKYIAAVDSFYKYHATPKSWSDAKEACAQEGASLFYPENSDEANAVISFWKEYENNTPSDDTWVYVGISDIMTEGKFETIDGKSISVVYNIWKANMPDNYENNEDCLHLNQIGNLNDIKCDATYHFICKKSLPPTERNYSVNIQDSQLDGQQNKTSLQEEYKYIAAVDSLYKYHATPKSWSDAKQACAQEGASLFYPENSDEANAVISFWKEYENNTPSDDTWVYVGISDIMTEGKYETIDGKSISEVYNIWKANMPDNYENNEDCLHLNQIGNLNDIKCDATYHFICKKSLPPPERNYSGNIQDSQLDGQQNKTSLQEEYKYIAAVDSFYKYHATPKSWSDAKQACAQEGASLFYPENSDEANAVISFWKEYENNTPSDDTWVYVGISDIMTEGKFETIDGKSISEVYNIWKANMPDNYENNEDCLHLNQIGNLNDIKCDATYHFICKKSLPPPERNYSGNSQDSQLDGQQNKTSLQEEYKYIAAVDSFYKYHATPKSWSDAKEACAQEGASLFYPQNSDEANAVISFWKEYENNTPSDDTWVYVGISDIMTEGKFETIDGKSISEVYNIWKANMPDNYENNEDCLHLNQIGNLNDIKCDATYHFICKKNLPPTEQSYSGNNQDSPLDGQQKKTSLQEDYKYVAAVDSFYKYHATPKNWSDAKQMCAQEGASLFYPENSDEANAVISFWKEYENNTPSDDTWVYVGISDIMTEGKFETIDGKSISEVYNIWKPNNPDNYENNEDCLHLNQQGILNDIKCDAMYNFICKKSLSPLQQLIYGGKIQDSKLDGQQNKTSLQENYKYIAAEDSFYKYHATPMNWSDAKQMCAQEGASLFYPENSDEANAVISFWKEYENNTPSDDTWVYVGISDIMTEGKFETIDGKSISEVYNIWKPNNPDNYENNEDCLHLNQQGILNDIKCDAMYNFICKKSLSPLQQLIYGGKIQDSKLDGQQNKTSLQENYKYIAAEDSFYKYHATPMNWSDAKQMCAQEGASLFYPENSDEANAVISFWKEYENNTPSSDAWVYVGISDIITEGEFETIDGKSISEVYNIWKPNNPDNYENIEDCLHLNQQGNLNDIKCDATYNFICKKSLPAPEQLIYRGKIQDSKLDDQIAKKLFRNDYKYIEAEESFYKIHKTPQTWADAKRVCALEGATFWHPENDDEARAVIPYWNTTQSHVGWMYVGLSDKMVKGLFETTDGKAVSDVYNNWQPNQPDNYGGTQDCVYINKDGYLDDWPCDYKYSFICKKTLQSLTWNSQCNMPNLDYTFNEDTGKCYKLHTTPMTWNDSYAVCRLEKSQLAVISSQKEIDYLVNLTASTPSPRVKENYQRGIFHVGFHNRFNEGWQTVKGTPMNVDADAWWDSYQPAEDRDQCGSMFYTGRLIDTDCDMKSFFICEHELVHS